MTEIIDLIEDLSARTRQKPDFLKIYFWHVCSHIFPLLDYIFTVHH